MAWAAGFFDGEGCVMLKGVTAVCVAVTNTHLPALQLLHKMFGGTVRRTKRVDRDEVRQAYQWYAGGANAVNFLECVAPFLFVKRNQVWIALRFRKGLCDPATARLAVRSDKRFEYRA